MSVDLQAERIRLLADRRAIAAKADAANSAWKRWHMVLALLAPVNVVAMIATRQLAVHFAVAFILLASFIALSAARRRANEALLDHVRDTEPRFREIARLLAEKPS